MKTKLIALMTVSVLAIVGACSSEGADSDDPPGLVCEYTAFGETGAGSTAPTSTVLDDTDAFIRFKVTGHEDSAINLGTVEKVLFGDLEEDSSIEVQSQFGVCLETGREYFVLLNISADRRHFDIADPWSHYPIINNRITLHQDMRKDDLVGNFHGLDPVLFERRFADLTETDRFDPD